MFKFLKITLDKTRKLSKNTYYLPRIFFLYKRYEKFLHDDYTPKADLKKFLDLISQNDFFWAITDSNDEFAGFVYLDNIIGNKNNLHSAEITTCFEQKFWGMQTYKCAIEFFRLVFEQFGFYKIKAEIYPQNFRVKTLLKKCGFQLEGILKNETLKDGKTQDIELYSLLNTEKSEDK